MDGQARSTTGLGLGADPALFDGKNPDVVFEIVRKYESPESPASQDVADAFEAYVKDNPHECSQRAPSLGPAHPRIQHSLFAGLRDAIQDNQRMEWDGVLSLIRDVVARWFDVQKPSPDGSGFEAQSYDQMVMISWLLEDGFKKDSLDFGLRDKVGGVLEELVRIGAAYGEHAQYPNKTGALTMSLNNLNGASFHAVYRYAMWCRKHDKSQALAPEAKLVFDEYLDGDSHTASRHAVLGIFLPDFYYLDQEWAKNMYKRTPSSTKVKIAFWDGYVSGKQMYSYVFEDLWEWYDKFSNDGTLQNPDLARAHEATITHIMLAYFYDLAHADGIVKRLLERNDPEAADLCVRQTGPILAGKRDDPNFNKEKAAGLWKHPSFKNHNLDMWFINTPLDDETAIGLYRDHIIQYQGRINSTYNPVYKLGEYAENFPLEVAESLEALVPKHNGNVLPEKVREILGTLSKSEDPLVKARIEMVEKMCDKLVSCATRL